MAKGFGASWEWADFPVTKTAPNPFLEDAAKAAVEIATWIPTANSAVIANTTVSKPLTSIAAAPEVVGGKKVAPSVSKLKEDYLKLLTMVAELTDKLEKVTVTAETAYALAQNQQHIISMLQNQLMTHYHPGPSVQVNGVFLALPEGQPPVITG